MMLPAGAHEFLHISDAIVYESVYLNIFVLLPLIRTYMSVIVKPNTID